MPRPNSRFTSTFHTAVPRSGSFEHLRFHSHPHLRWYWPHGYAYYGGYYDPFYWDRYNSSYDSRDDDYSRRETARQIDELSSQVQDLREERDYRQTVAAPAPPAPGPLTTKAVPDMSTVLVFLDRRIQEVKNYAIANEQVLVYDDHRTKKIPLMDLDLAATQKLNDERGVDFQIPNPTGTE
jgi:hypothetical protein